jgi:hypothetical protein
VRAIVEIAYRNLLLTAAATKAAAQTAINAVETAAAQFDYNGR